MKKHCHPGVNFGQAYLVTFYCKMNFSVFGHILSARKGDFLNLKMVCVRDKHAVPFSQVMAKAPSSFVG